VREGLAETLTVVRLALPQQLCRVLSTTNAIENLNPFAEPCSEARDPFAAEPRRREPELRDPFGLLGRDLRDPFLLPREADLRWLSPLRIPEELR
jgi:hypothetical protein